MCYTRILDIRCEHYYLCCDGRAASDERRASSDTDDGTPLMKARVFFTCFLVFLSSSSLSLSHGDVQLATDILYTAIVTNNSNKQNNNNGNAL